MPTTEEGGGLGLGTARVRRGTALGKRLLLGKESEAERLGPTWNTGMFFRLGEACLCEVPAGRASPGFSSG